MRKKPSNLAPQACCIDVISGAYARACFDELWLKGGLRIAPWAISK